MIESYTELIKNSVQSKLLIFTFIVFLIYYYLKVVTFSYWKKRDVPYETPIVPLGNVSSDFLMKKVNFGILIRRNYEKFKKYAFHGLYIFNTPVLVVNDMELIKQILIKDFSNFQDRGFYCNKDLDPMSATLFLMGGEQWRVLRTKLSPVFTSGKLKRMFPLVTKIADNMVDSFDMSIKSTSILNLKELAARYTTDTIFSLAFGVESQTLKNPHNEFREMGDLSIKLTSFKAALSFFNPSLMYKLKMGLWDKKATKFFTSLFLIMIEKRRISTMKRNDFLDLLIELIDNEQVIDKKKLDSSGDYNIEKIVAKIDPLDAAAQAYVFFQAGFETTSSSISHCLFELALNPECQEKLQEEVDKVISSPEGFTYESMRNMEYLDMVFYEAGRKHPSLPQLNRECQSDYHIPNSNVIIPKGMGIIIPVLGIHYDPEYYPDPEKFDPTRFNKENTAARNPLHNLFFGEGPRICIGKRLGVLQVKVALVYLIRNYKFSVCDRTVIPAEYTSETVVLAPKNGIMLKVEKRHHYKMN